LAVKLGESDFDTDNIIDIEKLLSASAGLVTVDEQT
jgi:hypothetical protein